MGGFGKHEVNNSKIYRSIDWTPEGEATRIETLYSIELDVEERKRGKVC